jgi:hypothetical protein
LQCLAGIAPCLSHAAPVQKPIMGS